MLANRFRRYRVRLFQGFVFVTLVAFIVMAALATFVDYFEFDLELTRLMQTHLPPWFGWLLQGISWPGYTPQGLIIPPVVALVLYFMRLPWEGTIVLLTGTFSGIINSLIKLTIQRPRPTEDLVEVFRLVETFSFPSGHVMFYTTFFGFLAFLSFTLLSSGWRRSLLLILFGGMVGLVGFSRIYLGAHWASDVIAAYLLGFLILAWTIRIYRWGRPRFHRAMGIQSKHG